MQFSPLLVTSLLVGPLRYFFGNYTKDQGLIWHPDEKIRTIDVGSVNDFHGIALEQRPRILINRGTYRVSKTGLTDNLAQSKSVGELTGRYDRNNMVWIDGMAQITIEARQEGTCELLADMVSHFIVWSRPFLCDSQGFKELGLPLQVSECSVGTENTEKFTLNVSVPYMMEEQWHVEQESLKLKQFYLSFIPK